MVKIAWLPRLFPMLPSSEGRQHGTIKKLVGLVLFSHLKTTTSVMVELL